MFYHGALKARTEAEFACGSIDQDGGTGNDCSVMRSYAMHGAHRSLGTCIMFWSLFLDVL